MFADELPNISTSPDIYARGVFFPPVIDDQVPVLVIAGSADRLLPSPEEAERLKGLIPGCRTMVLEGHGHAPLFDGRVDMSEIIAGDPAMECVVFPEAVGDDTPEVRLFM